MKSTQPNQNGDHGGNLKLEGLLKAAVAGEAKSVGKTVMSLDLGDAKAIEALARILHDARASPSDFELGTVNGTTKSALAVIEALSR